jgi:hypothetical protein
MTHARRAFRFAIYCLASFVFLAGAAYSDKAGAETVDPFTVEDVPIDATASDVGKARAAAIAAGQMDALKLLFRRLARPEDYDRLPKVAAGDMEDLLDSYTVRNEKSSAVRYLALLTARFKPDRIRALLKQAGVAYVDSPSGPTLVLPVYRAGDRTVLWEDPNPWRDAWNRAPLKGGLVPFVQALGDLEDLQTIDDVRALKRDPGALAAVAKRYQASAVVIAYLHETGGDANTPELRVTIWLYDADTKETSGPISIRQGKGDSRGEVFIATVRAVASVVEQHWKRQALAVNAGAPQSLRAVAPISSLSDWTSLRRQLESISEVRDIKVLELSREGARIEISYVGDLRRLTAALSRHDIAMTEEPGMAEDGQSAGWVLRRGGAGATGQPAGGTDQ